MQQWSGHLLLAGFVLAFVLLAVAFVRKSRRRRREMFEETPFRRVESAAGDALGDAAITETPRDEPWHARLDDVESQDLDTDREVHRTSDDDVAGAPPGEAPVVDAALRAGLARTSEGLLGKLGKLLGGGAGVDGRVLDELEEALLVADVGVKFTTRLLDELRVAVDGGRLRDGAAVRAALKERMLDAVRGAEHRGEDPLEVGDAAGPRVILFVGVNGVGKTTTIGKIASKLRGAGKTVLLAAGDTFRAAAAEQLTIWAERAGCEILRGEERQDPASVVFNAVTRAAKGGVDVVLADTAGRLHTKTELMDEIRKVKRAAGKASPGAPHEVWLVVDATTGQNALRQADEFNQALGVTGVILTKLDGTAKGGVVVAIADGLKLPVVYVGIGEQAEDLRPFDASGFVEALFAA